MAGDQSFHQAFVSDEPQGTQVSESGFSYSWFPVSNYLVTSGLLGKIRKSSNRQQLFFFFSPRNRLLVEEKPISALTGK